MKKKITIAGGTGFIGSFLETKFKEMGYDVFIISRNPKHISWTDEAEISNALEDSEILINLAGKSVDCRYHQKNKDQILSSRVNTTRILGKVLSSCKNPPPLWLNSSTATIYRHSEDRPMSEAKGEIGTGFSVDVAKQWEQSFFEFSLPQTRQVALRIAIVLGKGGGVITPFLNMVRFGLGGVQGPGNQMFSWIHLEDLFQIILFIQKNKNINGVVNCSSPNPITNSEFMKTFRKVMNRKWGLPSPKFLLEIGAFFIRTETELLLKSRWVVPDKLQKEGYSFLYPDIESTLKSILGK